MCSGQGPLAHPQGVRLTYERRTNLAFARFPRILCAASKPARF
jgi:hypothetical protein